MDNVIKDKEYLEMINPDSMNNGKSACCPSCLRPYVELDGKIVSECFCGKYFTVREFCNRCGMVGCSGKHK